jgi:hypothetical protein
MSTRSSRPTPISDLRLLPARPEALQGVVAALASEPRPAHVEGLLDALRAEIAQARLAGA